jgi:hypothetical protein
MSEQRSGKQTIADISELKVKPSGSSTAVKVADHLSGFVNVRSYGAKGDGVTDDTAAIQAAIDTGKEALLPPPSVHYKITAPLMIGSGEALVGLGRRPEIRAYFNGDAVVMSGNGVLRNVSVNASPAYRTLYTGVKVDAGASPGASTHGVVRDVSVLFASKGFWVRGGVYFWDFDGLIAYQFHDYGILTDSRDGTGMSAPNNNVFRIKELSSDTVGDAWAGVTWEQAAIKVAGNVNTFIGGEPAPSKYGVIVGANSVNNRFVGMYGEHEQIVLKAGKGSVTFWDSHAWIQPLELDDDAKVYGPSGEMLTPYNNWLQRTVRADKSLKALYLFNEGSGDVVIDHSGNGKHMQHYGSVAPTWTENGRWGKGLQLDVQNNLFLLNSGLTGAFDATQPFTIAVLMRRESVWGENPVLVAFTDAGSRYMRVLQQNSYIAIQDYNGSSTVATTTIAMRDADQDAWSWVALYFDPVNKTVTSLDPFAGPSDLATTNTRFSPWASGGGAGVTGVSLMRHPGFSQGIKGVLSFVGVWQRKLTFGEVIDLVNMKVPNLWPSGRPLRTVKEIAFARDGATTEARHRYAAAMPTTGSWRAGDIVWNATPAEAGTAGGKYVITGWSRLTTGSANVLNTDWLAMRALTGN